MEVHDLRIVLAPALSLACAILIFLVGRHDLWRAVLTLTASVVKLGIVLSMLPGSLAGTVYVYELADFPPGIGIGFTDTFAWTHTVSAGNRFTAYTLTLVPGDPTSYLVDGEPRP